MQLLCPQCSFPILASELQLLNDGDRYQCPKCRIESQLHIDMAVGPESEQLIVLEPLEKDSDE